MAIPRILIVEDERSLVEPLAYNLQREGFEVYAAFDGQDGVRQAQLKVPDLVVLDLMLPLKGGIEVTRELRSDTRTRQIPIIMVTAKAEEADQLVGFAVGAGDSGEGGADNYRRQQGQDLQCGQSILHS